ncbi:MAG: GNAT family N-acetyltransferase [Flavobacteriaceae bacterium]
MDGKKEIKSVKDNAAIQIVVILADEIWREHYSPIIGKKQVEYMLDNFQSLNAIKTQIVDGAQYYLIYYKDEPSGYFSFYLREDSLFLSKIYVKSSLRGKGLGAMAIRFIEDEAILKELPCISLTVNKNNRSSIDAYLRMGFKKIKPVVMDIGGGFVMDDYYLEKRLE